MADGPDIGALVVAFIQQFLGCCESCVTTVKRIRELFLIDLPRETHVANLDLAVADVLVQLHQDAVFQNAGFALLRKVQHDVVGLQVTVHEIILRHVGDTY